MIPADSWTPFNSTPERDFTVARFPNKYKSEFEDDADWLRLAFHSENKFPNEPYREAPPKKLLIDLGAKELQRIAEKTYTTGLVIHWGTVRADSYLRENQEWLPNPESFFTTKILP